MVTVADLVAFLKQVAPLELAAGWDNVGLLLGDPTAEVRLVMTCLTVTPDSAAEAIESGAQLIVTHHPVLFRPVQHLTATTPEGRMLLSLIRGGVAVYSPHTAFDNSVGGNILARRLGLTEVQPLRRGEGAGQSKIVVFVPDKDLSPVSDALFAAGAGQIGQYRECSFRLAGTGTFFGTDSTNPTVGQKGRREEVSEWRLEAVCPEALVEQAVSGMRRAHSYEEPAYDVYPLRPSPSATGEGRVGRLRGPMPLAELAQSVKAALGAKLVQTVGEAGRAVERVAVVCGSGGEFLPDAVRARADVLLTGEVRFHDCLTAQAQGLALVLPGHHATERCGVEELAGSIQQRWADLEVWASRLERDPLDVVI
ncbi:MAG: Nif3-like dinuclear metal center hexameric protein [Gemmataceae bacterium]|nr:Nif3-like dinuclear metal center hexameric protein [Gemmataceae bacterium]